VTHFTSFAVLLLPTARNNGKGGCGSVDRSWGWNEITSMILLGSVFLFCFLLGFVYHKSRNFRLFLMGRQAIGTVRAQKTAAVLSDHSVVNSKSFLRLTIGGRATKEAMSPLSGLQKKLVVSHYSNINVLMISFFLAPTVVTFGGTDGRTAVI